MHDPRSRHSGGSEAVFLAGGGSMEELVRATDWSATPLGAIETWSPSLRMMVSFLLANRFPLLVWCGAARLFRSIMMRIGQCSATSIRKRSANR